jgi:hypothetical protein
LVEVSAVAASVEHGHHDLGREAVLGGHEIDRMPRPLSSTVTALSKWMGAEALSHPAARDLAALDLRPVVIDPS